LTKNFSPGAPGVEGAAEYPPPSLRPWMESPRMPMNAADGRGGASQSLKQIKPAERRASSLPPPFSLLWDPPPTQPLPSMLCDHPPGALEAAEEGAVVRPRRQVQRQRG